MNQIINNQSLRHLNTFGLEGNAKYFVSITKKEELSEALALAKNQNLATLILGGGSNLLITKDFDGLVIKIENRGITITEENKNTITIKVAAGENWHNLVLYTLQHGWNGLENLSLIPGNVGASPMQNIGAYGVEVKNLIETVNFYNTCTQTWEAYSNEQCRFAYRESIFKQELKNNAVIWSVDFKLKKGAETKIEYGDIKAVLDKKGIEKATPKDVCDAVSEIRSSKLPDPAKIGNAGSFFQNPVVHVSVFEAIKSEFGEVPSYPSHQNHVKIPAGWLIETAGWKGKNFGNYGVHERQALVLVNYGGASGIEILNLSKQIQADVKSKFGIDLQMEVNLI